MTLGSTSFLVLLASSIYFMHIVMFVHARNTYVSIATKHDCGCVMQYRPSFSIKTHILVKPELGSRQPESSEMEQKINNYGRIEILKAEYYVTILCCNLHKCVCYHVGVCVCCLDKFSYCCTSRK